MRTRFPSILLACCLVLICSPAQADSGYDGMLSLSPVGKHSCLAVALPVTPGQPISGLSWIHNDGTMTFPRLLIMEGEAGTPPDLSQTALVLEEITGETLAWGEVTFADPVTSSTPIVYAVFQLPPYTEKTADGEGGGPAIGYVTERGAGAAYASGDGVTWTRLHPNFSMRVETAEAMGKTPGEVQSLASLRESRPRGWWDELTKPTTGKYETAAEGQTPDVSAANPLTVVPNPFNPRTAVRFYLPTPGRISVEVYDLRGRLVRTLLRETASAGPHEIVWQGVDNRGAGVASGTYIIRLKTPTGVHQTRAALVR